MVFLLRKAKIHRENMLSIAWKRGCVEQMGAFKNLQSKCEAKVYLTTKEPEELGKKDDSTVASNPRELNRGN